VEVIRDFVDLAAHKSHILKVFRNGFFSTHPDPVSFQVYADEISLRIDPCQTQRIFSFATGKLQGDGVVILEIGFPLSLHVLRVLEDVGKIGDFCETNEFFLAHDERLRIERSEIPPCGITHSGFRMARNWFRMGKYQVDL
jgi:hypothetical protein